MDASDAIEWAEDDLVMISALEHYSYCPRQCALIHVEQTFDENLYTLRGRAVHERVDEPVAEFQEGVRVERALPLWSKRLGLDWQSGCRRVSRRYALSRRIQAWIEAGTGARRPATLRAGDLS